MFKEGKLRRIVALGRSLKTYPKDARSRNRINDRHCRAIQKYEATKSKKRDRRPAVLPFFRFTCNRSYNVIEDRQQPFSSKRPKGRKIASSWKKGLFIISTKGPPRPRKKKIRVTKFRLRKGRWAGEASF